MCNEKYCINLGTKEAENGPTYMALSRAKKSAKLHLYWWLQEIGWVV